MNEEKICLTIGIIVISLIVGIVLYKFVQGEYYEFLLLDNMKKQNEVYTKMINISEQSKQQHKQLDVLIQKLRNSTK